jgi:mannose-6-phosphate isomerase-like protein (cupin superfamily)
LAADIKRSKSAFFIARAVAQEDWKLGFGRRGAAMPCPYQTKSAYFRETYCNREGPRPIRKKHSAGISSKYMDGDSKSLERKLQGEGFRHTCVWQDGPNALYADHTHERETAHVILDGEMTLTQEGVTRTFIAGERCDVPAGAVHSARMGPQGCRYVIGEK